MAICCPAAEQVGWFHFILISLPSKIQCAVWYPIVKWPKNDLHRVHPGKAYGDEINM